MTKPIKLLSAEYFRKNLSSLIGECIHCDIILTRHDKPVARLSSLSSEESKKIKEKNS
jgi:antitoxin (DNA-binding transcriptional repressor) of toxin-antitoxin stability system